MLSEIKGYLGGIYKGSFKDKETGKDINYSKVLILTEKNSTEYMIASIDSKLPLDKLKRFGLYTFSCDVKGDKTKVVDVFE